MHAVAAKLPLEIALSFQQQDVDALARQQERQHQATRPGADDAALCCIYLHEYEQGSCSEEGSPT